MGASKPTIAERPVLDQPPLLVNSSRATSAFARGAMTQSGIIIAKQPKMWRIKIIPSEKVQLNQKRKMLNLPISGSRDARAVLKIMQKKMVAIASKVPCNLW